MRVVLAASMLLAGLGSGSGIGSAWAEPIVVPDSPYAACDTAIGASAKLPGRPPERLVPTIARVESGRLDPASGRVRPWPWTINVDGVGYFFDSKAEVIAAVQAMQAKGKRSIDVGCMQVNLLHHPRAFADLEEAFDPAANARYAVRFLTGLYGQTRDWALAAAMYHSSTPEFGEEYQRLVFGRVLTPMGASGGSKAATAAGWQPAEARYGAIPPASFNFAAFGPAKPTTTTFGGVPMMAVGAPLPAKSSAKSSAVPGVTPRRPAAGGL